MRNCVITWQPPSMPENGFHTKREELGICSFSQQWVISVAIVPGFCSAFAHGTHVQCCLICPRTCSYTSYSQPWRRPPSAGGHAVWGMWLRCGTWAAETESLLHFLKCQVSVTGFGFKTLSTKVCPWTLKWRCSWIHREWYHSYWQPSVHIKDRCISTCQVKTNKSIALYQVGWQTTPLPFVITGIPFPGPPEKDIHSSKINKDHLSNTGHENIQTPTRWQLKCVLGL